MKFRNVKVMSLMPGLKVRFGEESDGEYWAKWIKDPDVERFYPMGSDEERDESVKRMQTFCKYKSVLTAEYNGEVAGIAYINLHPYKKIAHQALFTIIIDKKFRGKGIGLQLMQQLEKLAKESFGIEWLHLEVYEGNPAIRLYRRLGYREFGYQGHWIKERSGHYSGKIFMEKKL